jgi:predicted nuclease of predicted toxin-antitoxin system
VHIAIKVCKHLSDQGFHAEHVNTILDKWHTKDKDISNYADRHNLILVTKDQDFRNSYLLKRSPKKLLKINLGNISNTVLINTLNDCLADTETLNDQFETFMIEINKGNMTRVIT